MTQIPEEYKVASQAIHIMSAANRTLKMVQQVYVDLWNASYKSRTLTGIQRIWLCTQMIPRAQNPRNGSRETAIMVAFVDTSQQIAIRRKWKKRMQITLTGVAMRMETSQVTQIEKRRSTVLSANRGGIIYTKTYVIT